MGILWERLPWRGGIVLARRGWCEEAEKRHERGREWEEKEKTLKKRIENVVKKSTMDPVEAERLWKLG